MSRSIHTTWSQLIKEYKFHKGDENKQKLDKMYDDLKTKRQIKRKVIRQRKDDSLYVSTDPDIMPINIYDESEFIHYPINEKDIRAILKLLPKGIIDGLRGIELRMKYGEKKGHDDLPEPDPYTGRPGFEVLPGVFQPEILGVYSSNKKVIEIYAYVYKSISDFNMWNVFLKIYMLMTLAHEISHHFDFQYRMKRGRCLHKDKIEAYAENTEYKWLAEIIIPYVEDTYIKEIHDLNEWILKNAGIKIPLLMLAGDPRKTMKNNAVKIVFPVDQFFTDFVKEVYEGKSIAEARIGLAIDFYCAELHDMSLEIVETILKIDSKNIKALALKADNYMHQSKYEEAKKIVKKVLFLNKDEFKAWCILSDIFFKQSDWRKLLKVSEKALRLSPENWYRDKISLYMAEAMINTGDLSGAEEILNKISGSKRSIVIKKIKKLRECLNM